MDYKLKGFERHDVVCLKNEKQEIDLRIITTEGAKVVNKNDIGLLSDNILEEVITKNIQIAIITFGKRKLLLILPNTVFKINELKLSKIIKTIASYIKQDPPNPESETINYFDRSAILKMCFPKNKDILTINNKFKKHAFVTAKVIKKFESTIYYQLEPNGDETNILLNYSTSSGSQNIIKALKFKDFKRSHKPPKDVGLTTDADGIMTVTGVHYNEQKQEKKCLVRFFYDKKDMSNAILYVNAQCLLEYTTGYESFFVLIFVDVENESSEIYICDSNIKWLEEIYDARNDQALHIIRKLNLNK